jgi:hypothetical protein
VTPAVLRIRRFDASPSALWLRSNTLTQANMRIAMDSSAKATIESNETCNFIHYFRAGPDKQMDRFITHKPDTRPTTDSGNALIRESKCANARGGQAFGDS